MQMDHQLITAQRELERILFNGSAEPKALSLSLMDHITNGFSDDREIGHGGFARVYKGMLDNGMVAVKKLFKEFDMDERKFIEEVRCLMKAKHKNIVRFLGYCSDTQGEMLDYEGKLVLAEVRQRLLCFEYLPEGSLYSKITDASCGLKWRKRYQIIIGICDGLYYLHQNNIVHLDLKPQNILLDDNMMPKIIDFGLARYFEEKQSQVIASKAIGTAGYMAPEFQVHRHITFKLDIYSLGIVIMEILTGQKGYCSIDDVLQMWINSRLEKDKSHGDEQLVQVQACTEIAIECTEFNPEKRPNIQQIIDKLGANKSADECASKTGAYGCQDKNATSCTMHHQVHDLTRAILAGQVNDMGTTSRDRRCHTLPTDGSNLLRIECFPNLKELHFDTAFPRFNNLRILDISECSFQKFPDFIGQLKQLKYLSAPRIEEHIIPDSITKLSQLSYLKLRGSRISALPESIGDMKGLLHLDLSGCHGIRELPMSFAELKQLVHLNFSGCSMSISEAFGGFTKLQYLNLSVLYTIYTNRRGLAEAIGNLISLRYLNLSGCMEVMTASEDQIHNLVGSICTLSNLEHLDLSKNVNFSSIPASIVNLGKLRSLDLSGCFDLEELPDCMTKMVSLKVVNVGSWVRLHESTSPWSNIVPLPHFVVHTSSNEHSSNIILLQTTNPDRLIIDRLESVKSTKEAARIRLRAKNKIEVLTLQWTLAAGRFVDDKEVLEKLVAPSSVQRFYISGYRSVSISDWLMGIGQYLPNLLEIYLWDFPNCNNLPPLGQLPNLRGLGLRHMDSLEKWNTTHSSGEEGQNELKFPKLETLTIEQCAMLRIKPCLPRAMTLHIADSDNVLSTWEENWSQTGASFSSPITNLSVGGSKVPLHQWQLLHHLPALSRLTITGCSDLTSSPQIIQQLSSLESLSLRLGPNDNAELPRWLVQLTSLQQLKISHPKLKSLNKNTRKLSRLQKLSLSKCRSMTSLPQWFGELKSLKKFEIEDCEGIMSLPDSIQLTNLEYLYIRGCPTLREWCESEENKMKLVHIKEKNIW